jgi:polysaccharide export outer membrane protein
VIRAGDRIKISAIDYMEFDTTSIVSETGTISIKLIGDLHIEGVTRVQAEKMIAERIGVYAKSPTILVDISVVKGADARIVMLGSIARPDTFTVTAPISLVESLAIAGGTQTDADLRRIKIFRHDPAAVPLVFDLTNFVSSGTVRDMPKVGPGDIVFVPRDENFLRDFFGYLRDTLFLFGFFSIAR